MGQPVRVKPMRVIVNPLAGRGYGARVLPVIGHLLDGHGLEFDLVATTHPGEALRLARQAVLDGCHTVVAAGGDGTYQEVINGILSATDDAIAGNLGIIPVGSGCDFSWAMGIPADLEGACERLARGQTRVVDMGRVTVDVPGGFPAPAGQTPVASRYFDNTVGIGFDGLVTEECRKFKRLRGLALYLPAVLKTVFLSFSPAQAVIEYELDGSESDASPALPGRQTGRLEKTVLMATICNGQREGGGFFIAPDAKNDDGLFDICLADNVPRLQIMALIPHFMKGTHVGKPVVTMLRSRQVVITSPDPLIAHADGEILCTSAHRVECEVAARRLRVVC